MTSETLVVRGGRVVNDDSSFEADVLIEDGLIKYVISNVPFLETLACKLSDVYMTAIYIQVRGRI
jgi:dihydroorotase-like cyclic amidohydrolase